MYTTIEKILYSDYYKRQQILQNIATKKTRIKAIHTKYSLEADYTEMIHLEKEVRSLKRELKKMNSKQMSLFELCEFA